MKVNKCFILIFIFYILSTFFSSVFAVRHIDENYDYMYTYEPFVDSNIQDLVDRVNNDDRVASGDYYYFVTYNYGDRVFNCMLFRKSALKSKTLYLLFNGWGEYSDVYNCDTECFDIQFPSDFDSSNSNLIWFNGRNCWDNSKKLFNFTGLPDMDNKRYRFPFATNFDGDIVRELKNGETYYFYRGQPYLADNDYTLSHLNGSYFLIFPGVSDLKNIEFSICQTEHIEGDFPYDSEHILGTVTLDTSPPYYNSVDGDEYWWEVPYSAFADLSIVKGQVYNFRLQYSLDGTDYFVDREVTSEVDFIFSGSTRWS